MSYHLPLTRLPKKIDYCLFLIKEELKSRHFFNGLHSIGIEDVWLRPNLDSLILKFIGLDDGCDNTFKFYTDLMDRRSRKINESYELLMTQALKVYMELSAEKQRRREGQKRITEG